MWLRLALLFVLALVLPALAHAQNTVLQGGPWQPGHVGTYAISNSQPVLLDAGPAQGGGTGTGVGELPITARGTGLLLGGAAFNASLAAYLIQRHTRYTLDRSPGYLLASYLAPAEDETPSP